MCFQSFKADLKIQGLSDIEKFFDLLDARGVTENGGAKAPIRDLFINVHEMWIEQRITAGKGYLVTCISWQNS